ncbi:MAG: replicative DNA helicase [Mariprofundaceae bacterium]|nr:replicative DNA helicase [Mariprofundaceae bacterium]
MSDDFSSPHELALRERVPPHARDAECAVLGGIMLDPEALDRLEGILTASHFYIAANGKIFAAIEALAAKQHPVDALTVKDYLERDQSLDQCGGEQYLGDLISLIPTSANVKHYAEIVRERAILRQLLHVCAHISQDVYENPIKPVAEHLDSSESSIMAVAESFNQTKPNFMGLKELIQEGYKELQKRYEDKRKITGVSTGFSDLDDKTAGLQRGDLIVIAGRPSMGKTAFVMNLAQNAAIRDEGKPNVIAVFSLEMSAQQISMRLLAAESRVDMSKMRTGSFVADDWRKLASGTAKLSEAAIFVDDTPGISVLEVRSKSRRLKREKGRLDMILIDYLQLMTGNAKADRKDLEISEMTRSLKMLAKELDVPVLILSQLNRSLESRADKRPMMSDLRESGAIEQDADVIMFIYRDEVYNKKPENEGLAEIIIAKQRNGPIGTTQLTFLKEFTRFENHAGTHAGFD